MPCYPTIPACGGKLEGPSGLIQVSPPHAIRITTTLTPESWLPQQLPPPAPLPVDHHRARRKVTNPSATGYKCCTYPCRRVRLTFLDFDLESARLGPNNRTDCYYDWVMVSVMGPTYSSLPYAVARIDCFLPSTARVER